MVKSQAQSRKGLDAILPGSGKIAADLTEVLGTGCGTETTGDLLLDPSASSGQALHHPQITFGLVVIERHIKIIHKGQHSFLVFL